MRYQIGAGSNLCLTFCFGLVAVPETSTGKMPLAHKSRLARMLKYKKRLRLLVEELGGEIQYLHNDALAIQFERGRVEFVPISYLDMQIKLDLGNGPRAFPLAKEFCFDVTDCLANPYLAPRLLDYRPFYVFQLCDYVNDERGTPWLKELQAELARDPGLERKDLGGNRILASYCRGILILRDDLATCGTNVIEFNSTTPLT